MKRLSSFEQKLFGVAGLLVLGLVLFQPPPTSAGAMPYDYISPAELEDIRFIAEQRGWTEKEGIMRLGWQTEFVKLLDSLSEQYPDEFAGAAITLDSDQQDAFIAFKGEIPGFLKRNPWVTRLRVDLRPFRGYSESELIEQADELHQALLSEGFKEVVTWPDIETGAIETQLGISNLRAGLGYVHLSREEFEATLRSLLPEVASATNVNVSFVEKLGMEDHILLGGGQCRNTNGGSCTTGVMVRGPAGDGLSTAGHCDVIDRARDGVGDPWQFTTSRNRHEGSWGDFGWFTINTDVPSPDFFSDWGQTRTAHATSGIWNGMSICRFGQTTGRNCDEVKAKNIYWGIFGRTAVTKNRSTQGGDSGGPYYFGNNVYGIHKGSHWYLFKWRDWFSPLSNIDNALGVTVVVNPPPPPPPPTCNPSCQIQCSPTGGVCSNGNCACF